MRTTLTIDNDVLAVAKELAIRQHKSLGEIISTLARQALRPSLSPNSPSVRNGVPLLAWRSGTPPVTAELVAQLREELSE